MSKSATGEALSPAWLHYLNLPKCCHQLGTKCSNAQPLGTLLIQTITHHTQTLYCQSYLSNPQILVIFLKKDKLICLHAYEGNHCLYICSLVKDKLGAYTLAGTSFSLVCISMM